MNKIEYSRKQNLGWHEPHRDFALCGKVGRIKLYFDQVDDCWVAVDPHVTQGRKQRRVMVVETHTRPGRTQVLITRVDQQYQGLGLAPKIYKRIMRSTGKPIEAGSSHSPGGRSIWCSLAGMADVTVYTIVNKIPVILEQDLISKEPTSYELGDVYLEKYRIFASMA